MSAEEHQVRARRHRRARSARTRTSRPPATWTATAVRNWWSPAARAGRWSGTGAPDWQPHAIAPEGKWSCDAKLVDMNGDGVLDLVISEWYAGNVMEWYENPLPGRRPGRAVEAPRHRPAARAQHRGGRPRRRRPAGDRHPRPGQAGQPHHRLEGRRRLVAAARLRVPRRRGARRGGRRRRRAVRDRDRRAVVRADRRRDGGRLVGARLRRDGRRTPSCAWRTSTATAAWTSC